MRQRKQRREASRAQAAAAAALGGETYEQRQGREERQRKERIVSRSMDTLERSRLPARMEQWEHTVGELLLRHCRIAAMALPGSTPLASSSSNRGVRGCVGRFCAPPLDA